MTGCDGLAVNNLRVRYGVREALSGASFEAGAGEVFGLLGANGAGKTTALRSILGLTVPDSGVVTWRSAPVTATDRARFGYIPEERGLYPRMRVLDVLVYMGRVRGLGRTDANGAADRWLDRLGLSDRATSRVDTLSLGNQQRVQLASALIHDPHLLVLDEPFSGLDPTGVDALARILLEESGAGRTVIISSHQLDLVESMCSRIAILHCGRTVAEGDIGELRRSGQPRLHVRLPRPGPPGWALGVPGAVPARHPSPLEAELVLCAGSSPSAALSCILARVGDVDTVSLEAPRLSDVFRHVVREVGA